MKDRLPVDLTDQLSKLRNKQDPDHGLNLEGMRVLVHQAALRHQGAGGKMFNCQVIDAEQFKSYLENVKNIQVPPGEEVRMQVIIRNGLHYTTIDFKLSDKGNECIVLDAAHDPRMTEYVGPILKQDKGKDFFKNVYVPSAPAANPTENLQKDMVSCPIFSLDHAFQVASEPDIYKKLARDSAPNPVAGFDNYPVVQWDILPPSLLKNAQSNAWLETYSKNRPDEATQVMPGVGVSLSDYRQANQRENKIEDKKSGQIITKTQNVAVENLFSQYSKDGLAYTQKLSPSKVQRITQYDETQYFQKMQEDIDRHFAKEQLKTLPNEIKTYFADNPANGFTGRDQAGKTLLAAAANATTKTVGQCADSFNGLKELDKLADRIKPISIDYDSKSDKVSLDLAQRATDATNKAYMEIVNPESAGSYVSAKDSIDNLKAEITAIGQESRAHNKKAHGIKNLLGTLKETKFESAAHFDGGPSMMKSRRN